MSAIASLIAPGRRIGVSVYSLWLIVTVAVLVVRPGEVLMLAVIGAVGYVAFTEVQARYVGLPITITAAACFAAPLLYVWPVREYEEHQLSGPTGAFTSVGSLLPVAALLIVAGRKRAVFKDTPRLLAVGGVVLGAGAVASSIAATHAGSAFGNAWLDYGAPICLALAIFASNREIRDVRLYLEVLVLGALPQLVVAIAAYLIDFGLPTSARDLVSAKAALFRPHLIQDQALGNVGHLSDVCLALLLPATAIACARRVTAPVRALSIATTLAVITVLILVLSRSAIAVAVLILVAAFAVMLRRPRSRVGMTAVAAAAIALLAISIAPSVRHSYENLVPSTERSSPAPQVGAGDGVPSGESTAVRLAAQRTAWGIAKAHMPWGVGTGQYPLYDPVYTAPHSLPLQALSEVGILGAVGWLLVAAYAVWRGVLTVIRRQRTWWLEELAAAGSVLAVLVHGTIAGLTLSLGHDNVSALVLWIGLGCLAALERLGRQA